MTRDTVHTVDLEADRAIMAFVRESRNARDLKRVGSFLLMLTAGTKLRFLNYAIPDDGIEPSSADIDALGDAFRNAGRMPRLEFLPSLAPALEGRLLAHGFTVEQRLPLMACKPDNLRALHAPDGILLAAPDDDATLRAIALLQHEAFEDPEPVDDRTVSRLRRSLERGGRALLATDTSTGAVIGAGQSMAPAGAASEVVGVAVAQSHRRRGLAAAMVSSLVRDAFDSGLKIVFLEAAPGADGAYRNAGFQRTSTSVHMSLAGDSDA